MREYRFDVVRVICMTYIVAYFHLYGYVYPQGQNPVCMVLAHACLGLFTFVSGYLLGKKYCFGAQGQADVWAFYRKRILRIVPLFVVSSATLWLIGYNSSRATLNGLLCISPFVEPKPMTTYYIPVILWCYLVTPFVSRHGWQWRVYSSLSLFCLLLVASYCIPSIDRRFTFNAFFYFTGVVSAACFDWKLESPAGRAVKTSTVLAFVLFLMVSIRFPLINTASRQMAVGAVGVFVILFICEGISRLFFDSLSAGRCGFKALACRLVGIVSYASMACYMFHRFFYWAAEKVWNPSDPCLKWLFMAGLVYPLMLVFSYAIQKLYDHCRF